MLDKKEKENELMKDLLQSHEETQRNLNCRAAELESQLVKKDFKINQIERTCNAKV